MAIVKSTTGDTLDAYYGEFLISPVPLELSFNYCSHKCFYCFANLNKPGRWADVKATIRLLQNYQERDTLTAHLLKQGYPVLASNRVDPFAASNYQQAVPVLKAMLEMGIPLAFQTKGGKGIDEVLTLTPPAAWYVSISMLDDGLRRKLEPGAPDIDSRFALIEKLASAGHHVTLGLNPCVPEWLIDPMPLLKRAHAAGASSVWIERLHFNPKQIAAMSEREKAACGPALMARALKRDCSTDDAAHCQRAAMCAGALGMAVYAIGWEKPTKFFEPYRRLYAKTFPVMSDFVNHCAQPEHDANALIGFDEFWQAMPGLPVGTFALDHYVGATAHHLMTRFNVPKRMTYRQLLQFIWSQPATKQSPVKLPIFSFAAERNGKDWIEWQDTHGLPFLLYDSLGFDSYYCEVKEV